MTDRMLLARGKSSAPQQPFVVVACCFVVGALLGSVAGFGFWATLGVTLFLTLLIFLFRSFGSICCAVLAFGVFVSTAGRGVGIEGIGSVESIICVEGHGRASVEAFRDADGGRWRSCKGEFYFGSDSLFRPMVGDRYIVRLSVEDLGGWSGGYISSERVLMQLESKVSVAREVNDWFLERLRRLELSEETEAMAAAMSLGRREELSRERRASYVESGLSHLLALSGLHVSILIIIVSWLFRPLYILPWGLVLSRGFTILTVVAFGFVVGLSASVQRAVFMAALLGVSIMLTRRYRLFNSLMISVVALLCVDVSMLYNVGFRLSMLSVLAIALWAAPLSNDFVRWCFERGVRRWLVWTLGFVVGALLVGVSCVVMTWPIVSMTFGYVPFWGAFVSPFVTVTTFLILLFSMLWMILPLPFLAPLYRVILEFVVTIQNFVAESLMGGVELRLDWWVALGIYVLYGVLTLEFYDWRRGRELGAK